MMITWRETWSYLNRLGAARGGSAMLHLTYPTGLIR